MDIDASGWRGVFQEPRPTRTPDLSKAAVPLLFFAADLLARCFTETIGRRHHLSLAEWRCMMVLAPRPGLANIEVAAASGLDVMTVSRALRSLEQEGRLERCADPTDKRRITSSLTEPGLELYRAVAASSELLPGELKAQDRAQLGRYLKSVIATLR